VIDFVDVNNAALRLLDVVIAFLQQFLDDVFDVFANVTGLGQRSRIRHHERHVQ
jgi:hypothetical protein